MIRMHDPESGCEDGATYDPNRPQFPAALPMALLNHLLIPNPSSELIPARPLPIEIEMEHAAGPAAGYRLFALAFFDFGYLS